MAVDPESQTTPRTLLPMVLLLAGLSYAAEAQGAFYPGPFHVVVVMVALALLASMVSNRVSAWALPFLKDPLVALAGALILVTVISSLAAGHPNDAIGPVSLLLTMAGAVAVVKALAPSHRQLLLAGIVGLAVVVSFIGWLGVVARWQPNALTGQGLWRAASTLTYENALAAFLTTPVLLCLDRSLTATRRTLAWPLAAFVLLVGLGATLSRGGIVGLVIGVVVLGAFRGPRLLLRSIAPVVGALMALVCLAPSVPVDSPAHVPLACVGFLLGAVTAAWNFGSPRLRRPAVLTVVVAFGIAVSVALTGHVVGDIARARASASSSDRAHEWSAAWAVARHHLFLGVGTARVLLQWTVGGQIFTASFAHNEYLQLVVEDGVVGLGVLLIGLAGLFVRLAHRRGQATTWSAECAMAGLVALLVQSSLDFLWHIPVIPLLTATVLALATTAAPPRATELTTERAAEQRASNNTSFRGGEPD